MTQQHADRLGVSFDDFQTARRADAAPEGSVEPRTSRALIAFLCSDDAAYVAGQVIYVRGGP